MFKLRVTLWLRKNFTTELHGDKEKKFTTEFHGVFQSSGTPCINSVILCAFSVSLCESS